MSVVEPASYLEKINFPVFGDFYFYMCHVLDNYIGKNLNIDTEPKVLTTFQLILVLSNKTCLGSESRVAQPERCSHLIHDNWLLFWNRQVQQQNKKARGKDCCERGIHPHLSCGKTHAKYHQTPGCTTYST